MLREGSAVCLSSSALGVRSLTIHHRGDDLAGRTAESCAPHSSSRNSCAREATYVRRIRGDRVWPRISLVSHCDC
jgi:hypothetical protein